ncbi:GNAT family N-acetyltransferase [Streptomyces sp. NRRL S-340]|uniref:GNAT family N-acetyltransferase n=1 Tax=Streptomyces sp. NRRL S-340 TaxID=1463901 RepID=UPI000560DEC4|nr:GNAT family N-acetyltransferase [Streptomyces sp. NRRL S-340]
MSPVDAGAAPCHVPATPSPAGTDPGPAAGLRDTGSGTTGPVSRPRAAEECGDAEDTLDLRLPDDFVALFAEPARARAAGRADLLDGVGDWGPTVTPVGTFQLVTVLVERDLPVVGRWMNEPAVAEFWHLAGPPSVTEQHLRAQVDGDGRSVPCIGLLDGMPMSYWEIYRADLDPLARHYRARPHDTGVHLLIGSAADRGRGIGSALLAAVADLVLAKRPACSRVVAEPDLRNAPSLSAFRAAGFRLSAEVDLPGKRAALMLRDRTSRRPL